MTVTPQTLNSIIDNIVHCTPVVDMHTHLYPPAFGPLLQWGIDDLLTYHYLVAEGIRTAPMPLDRFWSLTKKEQAGYVWEHLFLRRAPISEACRGVVTCLQAVGIDPRERSLDAIRSFYQGLNREEYVETVFTKANVKYAVMTNDPFDPAERQAWEQAPLNHPRFHAALRMDPLLMNWETSVSLLRDMGYEVNHDLNDKSQGEIRRFLEKWTDRMKPRYLAVSLTPDFLYPDDSLRTRVLDACILPFARERNLPFALMIGVRRQINPALKLAGDGVGRAELSGLIQLCQQHPGNRFLVTLLSRENQHELCVIARKFPNLMPFGCWWFLNNPSLIEEITRQRIEMLGWSFIPQHSDARVLDQLLYKWPHFRRILVRILIEKYTDLVRSGWNVTEEEIRRDAARLLSDNFESFVP